jgi:tryptophan-rich sensory protein
LEALFAGGGIKQRLSELRVPRYVPPLWGWVAIGAFYYLICFVLLYRLFSLSESTPGRQWALGLLFAMLLINALWNYFFFRARNLFHAFVLGLPYVLIALALFALLLRVDRTAAFYLLPYLIYLLYAGVFGYRVWKLNVSTPS